MSIILTPAAAARVQTMLEKRGSGIGLHLSTKVSGCTGFAYVVDYADDVSESELVFETQGVKVIVPEKSMAQLDGMTLDYVKNGLLNEGFEFLNPNVKDMCGCGESFSI
jgi:iron-sulfur cluster assembly protein